MAGLRERSQQIHRENRGSSLAEREVNTPIALAPREYFAIVDGELVSVIGTTDIPGMSPAYWCTDRDGVSAPVSVLEAKIFTTAQQALQVLEQQRSTARMR
jgi:hypothetical protein